MTEQIDSVEKLKVSEQKTIAVLKNKAVATQQRFVPRREILREYRGASKGLKSLEQRGLVLLEEQQVYRDPFGECFLESNTPEVLTVEQNNALDRILQLHKVNFKIILSL